MSGDTWLESKLARWQELREKGSEPTPGELCAGDPEGVGIDLREVFVVIIVSMCIHGFVSSVCGAGEFDQKMF